jgi:hypothetical protein
MITAVSSTALDYSGRLGALAREPRLLWKTSVPYAIGHTRLYARNGSCVLAHPGAGLTEVGAEPPPDAWARCTLDLFSAGAAWRSDPVLIDQAGGVHRCEAGGRTRRMFDAGVSGSALAAIGLPDDRTILKQYRSGDAFFEMRDGGTALWKKRGPAIHLLPHDTRLFWEASGIHALDAASGEALWNAAGPLKRFIGVVETDLWFVPEDGRLAAIDAATGRLVRSIAVTDNRAVQGVLDERGRFHSTTGLRYQVYDLSGEGRMLVDLPLEGSSTAAGELACVAADGRVVFTDDRGSLFVFDPARPGPLTPMWKSAQPLANPVIANNRIYVLERSTLLCFG